MTTMLHPGVYVQEIPSGSRSIEGAPTSTAIFVGETERGPIGPTRIRGKSEYERFFGGFLRLRGSDAVPLLMPHAIAGFFDNGGGQAYILRAMDNFDTAVPSSRPPANPDELIVSAASPGVWGDSISVTYASSTDGDPDRFRIAVFYTPPGATSPVWVENWDRLSFDGTDENYVLDVLRRSNYIRGSVQTPPLVAFAGALDNTDDGPSESTLEGAAVALQSGVGGGGDLSDVSDPSYSDLLTEQLAGVTDAALLVAAADRMMPTHPISFTNPQYVNHAGAFITYAVARPMQDLFFVGDLPRLNTSTPITDVLTQAAASNRTDYNALYWPHVEVGDPVGSGANPTVVIPPSGFVAGVYARTDDRRGVWKAPAGVDAVVGSIRALDFDVLDTHQDNLNPNAINALRSVPAGGMVIWGARTRRPDTEWRYIPVRRTAMFLRKSIYEGIQWASLRATIGAFMETQFRNGAFFGTTSREAYFVKCDAETTPEIDRAAGVVNILVGFAPLRPAEFVVVKLSQKVNQEA